MPLFLVVMYVLAAISFLAGFVTVFLVCQEIERAKEWIRQLSDRVRKIERDDR